VNIVACLCEAIDCGSAPTDSNAVTSNWRPATNATGYNASLTYTCNMGYWYKSSVYSITIQCNATGYWTPAYVACSVVNCGTKTTPSLTSRTSLNNSPLSGSSTGYLATATYKCYTGYWYSAGVFSQTTTCLVNGSWSMIDKCVCK
jgi:hypothetical protein